jgi:flagellar basal-body rod protein FlgB
LDIASKITSISYLEKGLNAAVLRQEVLANNIANVETPGFKKSIVVFEEVLQKTRQKQQLNSVLLKTNDRHLPWEFKLPEPKVVTLASTSMRNDFNNVDIDQEMALLAKNSIYFQALTEQIHRIFSGLKTVINGGR